jgi:hypothetical protein
MLVISRAASGHDLRFEMPPKIQSLNSDGWPVYGEHIDVITTSTLP